MSSTARNMAAFLYFHLGHGADDVLGPEAMAEMHAPGLPPASLGGLGAADQMTLGFRGREIRGQEVLSHGGDTTICHSELALFPETDTGVFVSRNGNGGRALSTAVLRRQLIDQFARRYVAPPEQTAPEPAPGAAERAAAVAGHYPQRTTGAVQRRGPRGLLLPRHGGRLPGRDHHRRLPVPPKTTMQEVEPWLWREIAGTDTLAARADETGNVRDIVLTAYWAESRVSAWQGYYAQHLVLLAALAVLVITLVAWPVNRLRRRRRWGTDRPRPWRVRRLTYASSALVLVGLVLFVSSIQLQDYTLIRPLTRLGQAVLMLGVLGVIPAAWHLVNTIRCRAGVLAVTGAALLTLSLAYIAGYAVAYRILWPDLSI
ncbi:hypothetical protein [Kocuria sp. NPDC057446]|uniref:hypothetical protein n=1 Tax=Kocuria sp. NPDC057446 TaxID=3346137 RepID=UPI0036923AA8